MLHRHITSTTFPLPCFRTLTLSFYTFSAPEPKEKPVCMEFLTALAVLALSPNSGTFPNTNNHPRPAFLPAPAFPHEEAASFFPTDAIPLCGGGEHLLCCVGFGGWTVLQQHAACCALRHAPLPLSLFFLLFSTSRPSLTPPFSFLLCLPAPSPAPSTSPVLPYYLPALPLTCLTSLLGVTLPALGLCM